MNQQPIALTRSTGRDVFIGLWNRTLNALGRVDTRAALNDGIPVMTESQDAAGELRAQINRVKAFAYDAERNTFDYARARAGALYDELRVCAARLQTFDPALLQTDAERLAFWLNVYNVLILDAVIAFGIQSTVWQDKGFFRRAAYRIGGQRVSADEIEHGILRQNRLPPYMPLPLFTSNDLRRAWAPSRLDARLHCALNCASRSCPPIAVYEPARVDAQLNVAARAFVNASTQLDWERETIWLSPIFKWYAQDFGRRDGILEFVCRYWSDVTQAARVWDARAKMRLLWAHYDWSLNQ
jgi:hypothetical protein